MENETYTRLEERFTAIFQPLAASLAAESAEHVAHYVDNGELEMAYESFVLSLMEEGVPLGSELKPELCALGKELGLDRESVFKADFWNSAQAFLGCV